MTEAELEGDVTDATERIIEEVTVVSIKRKTKELKNRDQKM